MRYVFWITDLGYLKTTYQQIYQPTWRAVYRRPLCHVVAPVLLQGCDSAPEMWWAGCPHQAPPPCCKQERTQSYTTHTMWLSTRDVMGWMSTPGSTTMLQIGEDIVIHYTHTMWLSTRDVMGWVSTQGSTTMLQTGEDTVIHYTHNGTQHQGCDGLDVHTRLHHHAANRSGHSHTLHTHNGTQHQRRQMGWMSKPDSTTMLQTGEDTVIHYTHTMGLSTRYVMGWMSTPGSNTMSPPPDLQGAINHLYWKSWEKNIKLVQYWELTKNYIRQLTNS